MQMEHGRNMFGSSTYHSSFYGGTAPSFVQPPQPPQSQLGPSSAAVDTTPFPAAVSDVFYGGGGGGGGHQRLGYHAGYESLQADFQPPYFPPPNPATAQPVAAAAGLFSHHHRAGQVPVGTAGQQSLQQPIVDQSMYWSPINAAGVYTTGTATTSNVALHHLATANLDQQKTYHALQQV